MSGQISADGPTDRRITVYVTWWRGLSCTKLTLAFSVALRVNGAAHIPGQHLISPETLNQLLAIGSPRLSEKFTSAGLSVLYAMCCILDSNHAMVCVDGGRLTVNVPHAPYDLREPRTLFEPIVAAVSEAFGDSLEVIHVDS